VSSGQRHVLKSRAFFFVARAGKMRRTELRPMLRRRAISDLVSEEQCSLQTSSVCMTAEVGLMSIEPTIPSFSAATKGCSAPISFTPSLARRLSNATEFPTLRLRLP
jgi:hypothetical protein